jgi:microcystin-dependent protein
MALIDPCLFLQSDAHPARSFRMMLTQAYDEGVMSLVDLKVTERNAGAGGPNFSVDVAPGVAVVQGDSTPGNIPQTSLQGHYMCTSDAVVNDATTQVTSVPSAGNTRYDIVILEVKDNAEDSGGVNAPRFRVVPGTPATSGAVPPAVPNTAILLATIGPITNSTTTISNSIIVDARTVAGRRCKPGTIEWQADTAVASGWLACDGSAISRSTFARLFAHIGTQYGPGNGSTTFNLPNFVGRIPWPRFVSQAEIDTIGETGGEFTHVLSSGEMPAHAHSFSATTSSDGSHNHGGATGTALANSSATGADPGPGSASIKGGSHSHSISSDGAHTHTLSGTSGSQGSGSAHQNMPPYQVIGLIVIRS